jgi:hypothetical protein
MADPHRLPDSNADTADETNAAADRGPSTGTARWVKVLGIIAIVLVLMFGILLLTGRGHGPSRHMPSGDPDGGTPPTQVVDAGSPAGQASPPRGL